MEKSYSLHQVNRIVRIMFEIEERVRQITNASSFLLREMPFEINIKNMEDYLIEIRKENQGLEYFAINNGLDYLNDELTKYKALPQVQGLYPFTEEGAINLRWYQENKK